MQTINIAGNIMQNNMLEKKWTVAEYLSARLAVSEYTQKEIARRLGYSKPNIITMFKQGAIKVPIYKVPMLAELLHCDPKMLMHMVMSEYKPEDYQALIEVFGWPLSTAE